jgi:3-oxoacyl-[acyl-carrier-protein] synthase II
LEHIRKAPLTEHIGRSLSNSFGFGGQNVSLLLGPASSATARVR